MASMHRFTASTILESMYHNLAASFIFLFPLNKFQKLKLCFIRKRQRGAYQFFAQYFNICSVYCITFRVIIQHLASLPIIIVTGLYVDYCTLCSRKYKKMES
nr:MAG TPA_asm: hypothetical protein [Caudoviricetes sp.]